VAFCSSSGDRVSLSAFTPTSDVLASCVYGVDGHEWGIRES
jgi:hypothetical protein